MGHGNTPPLDDNNHRRVGRHRSRQKHRRSIIRLAMSRRGIKLLVVGMTQGRHMIPDYQDKFIPQPRQRTTLQPTAGTAQQLKRIFCGSFIGVFGPFVYPQPDRPARFRFQFNIQQAISLVALSPPPLIRGVGYTPFKP